MAVFPKLILPNHVHGRSFRLLMHSSISCFMIFIVGSLVRFTSLVRFVLWHFLRLLWMRLFSQFLSPWVHYWCMEMLLVFVYWFCILLLAEFVYQYKSILAESLGFSKYRIISSINSDNSTSSFLICVPFISFS
jgi:hypothetical protein